MGCEAREQVCKGAVPTVSSLGTHLASFLTWWQAVEIHPRPFPNMRDNGGLFAKIEIQVKVISGAGETKSHVGRVAH